MFSLAGTEEGPEERGNCHGVGRDSPRWVVLRPATSRAFEILLTLASFLQRSDGLCIYELKGAALTRGFYLAGIVLL